MPIRRLATCIALLAFSIGVAAVPPVWAQDKTVTLKLSTWVPPAHPLNPSLIAWAADIEKESGGTIKSTLFPSEQLGKAMDHYDMARDGIADLAYVNPGYQPGRFPIIAGRRAAVPDRQRQGRSARRWMPGIADTAAKEMKDVHVCFAFVAGSRHVPLHAQDRAARRTSRA